MKLMIAGDTHGNLGHVRRLIEVAAESGCRRIVQVGDWGFTWPQGGRLAELNAALEDGQMDMFWIDGNHDCFTDLADRGFWRTDRLCPFDDAPRVTYIPRGVTWEWDGATFLAMGGAFSIDQDVRVEGVSWWPEELIAPADLERAAQSLDRVGTVDVVLSHDCPDGVARLETYLELTSKEFRINYKMDEASRANRRALWLVVERARPRWLFHGHYHWPYTAELRWDGHACRVVGLDCDDTAESFTIVDTEQLKEVVAP